MNKHKPAPTHTSNIIDELLSSITPEEQARTDKRMMLAAKIAQAMEDKGWTAKKFGEEMDQHASVISKWLSGSHNFTCDTLSDIEEKLGVELLALRERKLKVTKVVEYRIVVTSPVYAHEGFYCEYPQRSGITSERLTKKLYAYG